MLRKVGGLVLSVLLAFASVSAAQSGNSGTTHVVLTNDQHFTVDNGKYLSGVYECSDGGYIDISCLLGQFPPMNCPAGQAIQSIDSSLNASCIDVGSGSGPAGADTYVQYNNSGIFGADQNFTWDYNNSILTLGGGGPGEATFSGDVLANLGTPSDGTLAYCTNCNAGTTPCTTGGTGSFALRLNGAWSCPAGAAGSGTVTSVGLTVPSGGVFNVTGSPVTTSGTLGITATGTLGNFPYFQTTSTVSSTTGFTWDGTKQNLTHTAGTLSANDFIYTNSGTFNSGGGVGIGTSVTTAGSSGGVFFEGINSTLAAGYTGAGYTFGGYFTSQVANTGTDLALGTINPPLSDMALVGIATRSGTGAGYKTGVYGAATGSTDRNIGVFGQGILNSTAGTAIGVLGIGTGSAENTNLKNVGGYFDSGGSNALNFNTVNANVAVFAKSGTSSDYLYYGVGSTGGNGTFYVKSDGTLAINTGGGLQTGVGATKTVRDAAGTGTCTLVFTSGILTGGTC